jgi:hypothetical protein
MDPISIAVEGASKTLRMLPGYAWTSTAHDFRPGLPRFH